MGIYDGLQAASRIVDAVGHDRIELVTITRDRICLQPARLDDGESIAKALGCVVPLDHRMFVPGHTLWTGERDGLEVQVRSVLRRPVGVAL
ncbi:hypothetical protein L1785_12070 [Antribacter sp. KLBMP9083]|uniref:Uncharacterized protein n=1 Tax=Antribacter soli TaxID=2910976 RepID=A0AA41QGL2_9MICO|nr:hypothetical protein [Antribacter soli]MCF4121719.1 hypothetical protein [Antribacter soli]